MLRRSIVRHTTIPCLFEDLERRSMLSAPAAASVCEPLVAVPQSVRAAPAAQTAAPHRTTRAAITYSGPITITKGGVYSGNWQSTNANIPAVRVRTNQPVTIQNSNIRSKGSCIDALGFKVNLTVRNVSGLGLNPDVARRYPGRFLDIDGFVNLVATNNYMENTSGIYVYAYQGNHTASQTVKVLRNVCKNVDGRVSDGKGGWVNGPPNPDHYKQFFQSNGLKNMAGAEVAWNQVINDLGVSRVEENINLFGTTGQAKSPFLIHDNYIQGAYPSSSGDVKNYTGGGIMLSDQGSSYMRAYNNQIVNTGSIGITITSGHDNAFYNNRIISSGRAPNGSVLGYSNVGGSIWNADNDRTFKNNVAYGNTIAWIDANGNRNDIWPDNSGVFRNNQFPAANPTKATEQAEFVAWQAKLGKSHISLGPAKK